MSCCEGMAKFFKKARIRAGLTQLEVAQALGYSSSQFISNWEREKCGVPLNILNRLIEIYGLKKNQVMEIILENEREHLKSSLKISAVRRT